MKKGVCNLCLEERKLCKKSHIIPDFMYQDLFNEDHEMVEVNRSDFKLNQKPLRTGKYESDILCRRCERLLNENYEDYAAKVLYGGRERIVVENYKKKTKVSNLNYNKFKLFLLSLLWRASISNKSFFDQVELGIHEEELREMLLNKDAGSYYKYPCILIFNEPGGELNSREIIKSPVKKIMNNTIAYNFLISGMSYIFKRTKKERNSFILEQVINKKGEMVILHRSNKKIVEDLKNDFNIQ